MIAICVDDEPILLDWLRRVVSLSPDVQQAEAFLTEDDALNYAAQDVLKKTASGYALCMPLIEWRNRD